MQPAEPAAVESCAAVRLDFADATRVSTNHDIVAETPVQIVYSSLPFAVMMCTPADIADFVYGFSLTEGVIANPDDIRAIEISVVQDGLRAEVALAGAPMQRLLGRQRRIVGRTGCGVCGVGDLAEVGAPPRARAAGPQIGDTAIQVALAAMPGAQTLNALTHSIHAAAWCDSSGAIRLLREDVGRHNALDKLVGALMREGIAASQGFIAITSRCSYEMVEKAAVAGVGTLVAISAPTSLAIARARHHGMRLVAIARNDSALEFTVGGGLQQNEEEGA